MGIALLSIADLFMPLQSLAGRWLPALRSRRRKASGLRYVGIRPSCASHPNTGTRVAAPVRPLRVVRMVDSRRPGHEAGRVVISGRIADVCAELDRLVALEAAGAAMPSRRMH